MCQWRSAYHHPLNVWLNMLARTLKRLGNKQTIRFLCIGWRLLLTLFGVLVRVLLVLLDVRVQLLARCDACLNALPAHVSSLSTQGAIKRSEEACFRTQDADSLLVVNSAGVEEGGSLSAASFISQ